MLTVKHLVKQYGDHIVLNDISLDIKKGEVIVVMGQSGCGKSTLLRCINALEPIQGGVIKLGDIPIEAKSKSLISLRQKIGMVFQSYDLFSTDESEETKKRRGNRRGNEASEKSWIAGAGR